MWCPAPAADAFVPLPDGLVYRPFSPALLEDWISLQMRGSAEKREYLLDYYHRIYEPFADRFRERWQIGRAHV